MRSPLALERTAAPPGALAGLQRAPASLGRRVDALATRIALHIESLVPQGRAQCLDIGRADLTLAEAIQERVPRTDWQCVDVRRTPAAIRTAQRCVGYDVLDEQATSYGAADFDVAVLCDVLGQEWDEAPRLLVEAARVARYVIVKDRFESGHGARAMLRFLVDARVGARTHLTRESFVRLVGEQGLFLTAFDCNLPLNTHLPVVGAMLDSDSHFIAVLQRS